MVMRPEKIKATIYQNIVECIVSVWIFRSQLCYVIYMYFYFKSAIINPLQEVTSACFSHYMLVLSLPFHPGSVLVGRGTIHHMLLYAYVLWRSSIESLHSHASPATYIFSQLIFTPFFHTFLHVQYRRLYDTWKLLLLRITAKVAVQSGVM